MYLIAVATVPNIEAYGIDEIMKPFVSDLNELTSSGITIHIDIIFRGALLAVIADNLASHQLGGFKGSVSFAFRVCRTCMATSVLASQYFVEEEFDLRTPSDHAQHCLTLQGPLEDHYSTTYGINRKSILEDVQHFSVVGVTLAHDVMHDLLEGVIPYEMKAFLKYGFAKKYFTLKLKDLTLDTLNLAVNPLYLPKLHFMVR